VVDLLICFALIAAKSYRRELILNPYPLVLKDENTKLFDPDKKDYNMVVETLKHIPSITESSKDKDFYGLKTDIEEIDPNSFHLLQWIISSNRSHIVLLPEEIRIKSMISKHQYLLLSAPPERENVFRKNKKKFGSCFAFHGSSAENWHSILRRGLMNASGTKLQINGAMHGGGIYLSPNAGTSFGYSRVSVDSPNNGVSYNDYNDPDNNVDNNNDNSNIFLNTSRISCIAICEVIDRDIRKYSGDIWVHPRPEWVVTRFFFVYTGQTGNANQCRTTDPEFVKELKKTLSYYYNNYND